MTRPVYELLVYENPVWRNYAFWSCIMVMKMLLMTTLTVVQRFRNKLSNDDASLSKRSVLLTIIRTALNMYLPHASLTVFVIKKLKVFVNPEDLKATRAVEVKFDDPHVERCRRAHRNDLESIIPYLIVSFIYVLSDPPPVVAMNLFRVAVGCRIFYTIVYAVYVLPQPARLIAFMVPYFITWYMAVQSAVVFVN